jgi:Na+-transporting methylmalonyl-CoA/oxaloacetate decarboxylase gamma subunit
MNALKRPLVLLVLILLIVLIGGFGVFLAAWDIPAPSAKIEKVIPNERFTR